MQEVRHRLVKNTEQATSKFTKHGHNKDGQEWMESYVKEATWRIVVFTLAVYEGTRNRCSRNYLGRVIGKERETLGASGGQIGNNKVWKGDSSVCFT